MPEPEISVVIPTYRRPHLVTRAVQSVLRQSYTGFEVVVVIDGVDDGTGAVLAALGDSRVRVVQTGENRGPAAARNFGVSVALGKYVALLDDDDEWTPEKLTRQMERVGREGFHDREFLMSCRAIGRTPGGDYIWPERLFRMGDDIGAYLLDRRTPFARPGMMCSGTLLFPRSLALRVSFPDDPVHEDWSWLILVGQTGTPIVMCDEAMFIYHLDPQSASQNKMTPWRASLDWGRKYRSYMSGVAFAGLLSSTTIWRAKRQGGWCEFFVIGGAMRREGRPSMRHWLMFASVLLLPSNLGETVRRLSFRTEYHHENS